jgi:putative ABC transport system permease protein
MNLFIVAYRFMVFDRPKTIGALAGIIIPLYLIGQQIGILIFLTNAMGTISTHNQQYIWVIDSKTKNVNALNLLDVRIQQELVSIPGVKRVYPLVIVVSAAKFKNGKSSGITLIGSEPETFAGGPWNLGKGKEEGLLFEGAISTDMYDQVALGGSRIGDHLEISGKAVYIAAQTKGANGFGNAPYSFTTIQRARYLAHISANKASAFLVSYEANHDSSKKALINNINHHIAGVRAWDALDLSRQTVSTILKTSGIAISFGTLIAFAMIFGILIIGLTLYSAANDRSRDYGTLKAIGGTNAFIRKLLLLQVVIYSIAGYSVATLLIEIFRRGTASIGMDFHFTWQIRLEFFLAAVLISTAGILFPLRRIARLEPAEVFKS